MTADNQTLDALLAIHLFGLDATKRDVAVVGSFGMNNCHETRIYDIAAAPWALSGGKQPLSMWVVPGGPGDYQEIEPYSTTGNGLLVVVDAMRKRGYWTQVVQCEAGWRVEIIGTSNARSSGLVPGSRGLWFVVGETLPMATALAALKALGVEVNL